MMHPILSQACLFGAALVAAINGVSAPAGDDQPRVGLIVHAADLAEAASAWRDYRAAQGWAVTLVEVSADSTTDSLRAAVRAFAASRDEAAAAGSAQSSGCAEMAVLLLGDVRSDGRGRVPTFYFQQTDRSLTGHQRGEERPMFASDHPYALLGEDESRSISVGRVPVSTNDDALAVLAKIRRYETAAPPGSWRHRVNYVAGEARFGIFDPLFEKLFVSFIDECMPASYDVTMTYAKSSSMWCPDPATLEDTTLRRLSEGAILFTYAGHGHARGLDSLHWTQADGKIRVSPILTAQSLERLPASGTRQPVALLSCCSAGWFDLADGKDCVAEAMLKHPDGPVAVIAGTRVTHPYGNALVVKEFTRTLVAHADRTCGEIDRRARTAMLTTDALDRQLDSIVRPIALATRWQTPLDTLRLMHVRMYALFGDPMMRVAGPGAPIGDLTMGDDAVTGTIKGMTDGRVEVRVETERDQCAAAVDLVAPTERDDIAARTQRNYPLANGRILWQGEAEVRNGAFRIALPQPLPERASFLRAHADGTRADGSSFEAFGGMRMQTVTGPSPSVPGS